MNNLTAIQIQDSTLNIHETAKTLNNYISPNLEQTAKILNKVFYQTVTYETACTVTLEEYLKLCDTCPENYEQSLAFTYKPTQIILASPTASSVMKALKNGERVLQPVKLFVEP